MKTVVRVLTLGKRERRVKKMTLLRTLKRKTTP
jgi:hypothetical protein